MLKFATLSLRATPSFAEEVTAFAKFIGLNKTQYLEQAIREKNERVLADRMRFLSKKLSQQDLAHNTEMDAATGDGLA